LSSSIVYVGYMLKFVENSINATKWYNIKTKLSWNVMFNNTTLTAWNHEHVVNVKDKWINI